MVDRSRNFFELWGIFLVASWGLLCFALIPVQAATYVEQARSMLQNLPPGASVRPDLEAELFAQANALRASRGVGPLVSSDILKEVAEAQAADMMLHGYVGHRSNAGYEFDSRVRFYLGNPPVLPEMGENAARDTLKGPADKTKARRLFQQWINSRPHYHTLVNSGFKFVSTGVVQRGKDIWAIQVFFAPLPDGIKPSRPPDSMKPSGEANTLY